MSKAEKSTKDTLGVDAELVRQLADLLEETGLSEIEYGRDEWHIRVSRGGTAVSVQTAVPATTPSTMPVAEDSDTSDDPAAHPGAVCSPMVGVVYTAPDPDTPAFVKVGDQINEGDTVLLVEAMKVFNPIRAPKSGKVTRILVSSGSPVEYGEPLLIIE